MITMRWIQALAVMVLLAACGNSEMESSVQPTQSETTAQTDPVPPCQLTMGWDPWEPYQYEVVGGQVLGLDIELLTAVADHAGCEMAFEKGSWRELLSRLQQGEVDLLAGATPTADREEFAWFTEPYRDEEFILFVATSRLPELQDRDLSQLLADGLTIGVVEGYLYGDAISALQDDPALAEQFSYAQVAETNISRLLDGSVDGIIDDKFIEAAIIRRKNLGGAISAHSQQFGQRPVSIMMSRASVSPELFEKLNESVRSLRDDGTIDAILARYLNS